MTDSTPDEVLKRLFLDSTMKIAPTKASLPVIIPEQVIDELACNEFIAYVEQRMKTSVLTSTFISKTAQALMNLPGSYTAYCTKKKLTAKISKLTLMDAILSASQKTLLLKQKKALMKIVQEEGTNKTECQP